MTIGLIRPINIDSSIALFSQDDFHAVDRRLTGVAFDVHNEFGRFLDERIYQAELAKRMRMDFDIEREMRIVVELDDFSKEYFVEFLINHGVILETKTADSLTPTHRAQVLNYLYLCDLAHATLLNFRSGRVQHEFVSTSLTISDRRKINWDNSNWTPLSSECHLLHDSLKRALTDWGACLEASLYRNLITHVLGGVEAVCWGEKIYSDGSILGLQKVHHLNDEIAFSITSFARGNDSMLNHHHRFLQHTHLKAIQWVNLNRTNVTFHTIKNRT